MLDAMNELDQHIELVSANPDGFDDTYCATLESLDGGTIWIHTGTEPDCRRWVRYMLAETIYSMEKARAMVEEHLEKAGEDHLPAIGL